MSKVIILDYSVGSVIVGNLPETLDFSDQYDVEEYIEGTFSIHLSECNYMVVDGNEIPVYAGGNHNGFRDGELMTTL